MPTKMIFYVRWKTLIFGPMADSGRNSNRTIIMNNDDDDDDDDCNDDLMGMLS